MKRRLLTMLLCGVTILSMSACGKNAQTTNNSNNKEKAVVKTYKWIEYDRNGKESDYKYEEYDEKGRILSVVEPVQGGESKITTTWTSDGNVAIGKNSLGQTIRISYDANGNMLSKETVEGLEVICKENYKYKNGVRCEFYREYKESDHIQQIDEEKYNEYGHSVWYKHEREGIVITYERKYTYDKEGKIKTIDIKRTIKNGSQAEDTINWMEEYTYDKNGYLKEAVSSDSIRKVKCDNKGNIIECCTYTIENKLAYKEIYTYYE